MSAIIKSSIATKPDVTGASRDDLRSGEVVTLNAFDLSHGTYGWTLAFAPDAPDGTPSAASLSTTTGTGPITFTVDNEGSYLVRLVVDDGLGTADTQFVRLRYLTFFGDLKLVSAGERRDQTGVIPVDASAEGWANDQNQNLQTLLGLVQRVSTSGRTLYVDANRGQDISNTPNDETIAEGYAQYSLVQSAITDALLLTPAPSLTNPVLIRVQPGYYEEDLTLAPHVHVMGMTSESAHASDRTVVIRTTLAGATEHAAAITSSGHFCYVSGIQFENVEISTNPVLRKTGAGVLLLHRCSLIQNGNDATSGPAFQLDGGSVIGKGCSVLSNNTINASRLALLGDTLSTTMLWDDCDIVGPSAVDLGPSNLPTIAATFRRCRIDQTFADAAAFCVQSNADQLTIEYSELTLSGGISTDALTIHPDAGVHGTGIAVDVRWSRLDGEISFDDTGVVGATALNLGASDYGTINLTGTPTQTATVEGSSIFFDTTISGISSENVQDALDHIWSLVSVAGLGGAVLSLDTAYDGITDPTVPTFGAGSGRRILADNGAVVIQAADPPNSVPTVGQSDGQLHVEGNVQLGGVGAPELDFDPNPFGTGPMLLGGRLIFPDLAAALHRAIPSFVVRANSTNNPLYHSYNLSLETASEQDASRDEIGRILLLAGDSLAGGAPPAAGSIYAQAGEGHAATGAPGDIWLSPGQNATLVSAGRVRLSNPAAATAASLTAFAAFSGGIGGTITFAVPRIGQVTATILVGDTLADVQTKINALPGLSCVIGGGNDPIQIDTLAKGPNADVYFVQDSVGNSLNTALGDFSIGSGAVFAAGTFPQQAGLACTGADELTVYDNLVVTGSASSSVVVFNRKTITNADSPYTVLDTDHYIGVDSTGGAVTIDLPTTSTGAVDGRELIIKDEGGDAAVNNIDIDVAGGALIDGGVTLSLTSDFASVSMVANGLTGASTRWYII
jgi:hypothetical protein